MILILCRRIILALTLSLMISCEASARDVYVRLSGSGSYSIGITQGMLVMTDSEGRLANLGDSAAIKVSGNNAVIMGNSFMLPIRITGEGFLKFNGKTYRGAVLITQRGGLLNVLDVEQYLCGVLPAEVGASWPDEALRAQAISARTYVLRQSMNRYEKGYDVVDTDSDQVYKGAGIETAKTNQAVSSTAGEILTYGKELAHTYFHSDSGGHTANISDVWGGNIPYLTGVPEVVSYKSPVSTWNARISASKIQNAIKKITGTDIGNITEIQVSEVDDGGRAVNMKFIGSKGTKTIKASQFRTTIDPRTLKSTMFTPSGGAFSVKNDLTPSGLVSKKSGQNASSSSSTGLTFEEEQGIAQMTAEGIFTSTELVDMLTNPDKKKNYYQIGLGRSTRTTKQKAPVETAKPRSKYGYSIEKSGNDFIFYGRGWGHGVGLCQWGAMAMAEQGYTAERILTHYYPGTSVRKFR
ncbi:MAG: SpoIID/LytB domain-containing protein [Synergistaceae bacterium]|nr:SpoIID/LytB domain-containing protein [Synergistaceae bacterium]